LLGAGLVLLTAMSASFCESTAVKMNGAFADIRGWLRIYDSFYVSIIEDLRSMSAERLVSHYKDLIESVDLRLLSTAYDSHYSSSGTQSIKLRYSETGKIIPNLDRRRTS
jgi:hypothetical protein